MVGVSHDGLVRGKGFVRLGTYGIAPKRIWGNHGCAGEGIQRDVSEHVPEDGDGELSASAGKLSAQVSRNTRLTARRGWAGEVRWMLFVRGGVPGELHLYRGGREHGRESNLGRGAVRQGL